MESILKEVNTVGGVSGSFVCDEAGQVLASAMPGVFDDPTLDMVSRTMAQTLSSLQAVRRRKINELDLVYAGGRLIVKATNQCYLVILCVRNVNVPLLNLMANMALKKLSTAAKKESPPARAEVAAPAPQPPVAAPAAPAVTPQAPGLDLAVPALANLAEALILGVGDMGIGRTTLLTILEPRYRAMSHRYRFLTDRTFTFGKLNLGHLCAPNVPPAEAVAALGELINEIYRSGAELLGQDRGNQLYRRAFQSIARKNETCMQQPAVLAVLPRVA